MFVELTNLYNGKKFLLNKLDILSVDQDNNNKCFLETSNYNCGNFIYPKESYEEVKRKLMGEI